MTTDSSSNKDLSTQVADRAVTDPAFRAYVITDPRAAISAVLGVVIPEGVEISVHQSTPTHVHIALPARFPGQEANDLGAVSGGGNSWNGSNNPPPVPRY